MDEKKGYEIEVEGCDAKTVITMELTETEMKLIDRVAKLITNTSEYGCMPTMRIGDMRCCESCINSIPGPDVVANSCKLGEVYECADYDYCDWVKKDEIDLIDEMKE